jgi:hypothetical protein
MHTVDDIMEMVRNPATNLPGNKYLGVYNKLLSGLFEESRFLVTFPKQNCMEVVICKRRIGIDPKSVLLLALDEEPNSDSESAAADAEMQMWWMEANTPEIQTIHGLCVWETKVAFYRYDREQGVVTPNKGHVHFDLDMKEEDGAAAVIEVAKDVKRMCKPLVKEAKTKIMRS